MKKLYKLFIVSTLFLTSSFAYALTKPGPDANIDNLSYAFYLYYDQGQLFADRDYAINFDVVNEVFSPETVNEQAAFKAEIFNFKSELVKTFTFDPQKGNPSFTNGKIIVKGPYVSDGLRVQFYDNKGAQLLAIFVNAGSICNDDGACNAVVGENELTCPNDCKKPRATPTPSIVEEPSGFLGSFGDFDLNTILIYVFGGLGVIVVSWLGWKWWKKKRGESFLPPPPPATPPPSFPMSPSM